MRIEIGYKTINFIIPSQLTQNPHIQAVVRRIFTALALIFGLITATRCFFPRVFHSSRDKNPVISRIMKTGPIIITGLPQKTPAPIVVTSKRKLSNLSDDELKKHICEVELSSIVPIAGGTCGIVECKISDLTPSIEDFNNNLARIPDDFLITLDQEELKKIDFNQLSLTKLELVLQKFATHASRSEIFPKFNLDLMSPDHIALIFSVIPEISDTQQCEAILRNIDKFSKCNSFIAFTLDPCFKYFFTQDKSPAEFLKILQTPKGRGLIGHVPSSKISQYIEIIPKDYYSNLGTSWIKNIDFKNLAGETIFDLLSFILKSKKPDSQLSSIKIYTIQLDRMTDVQLEDLLTQNKTLLGRFHPVTLSSNFSKISLKFYDQLQVWQVGQIDFSSLEETQQSELIRLNIAKHMKNYTPPKGDSSLDDYIQRQKDEKSLKTLFSQCVDTLVHSTVDDKLLRGNDRTNYQEFKNTIKNAKDYDQFYTEMKTKPKNYFKKLLLVLHTDRLPDPLKNEGHIMYSLVCTVSKKIYP